MKQMFLIVTLFFTVLTARSQAIKGLDDNDVLSIDLPETDYLLFNKVRYWNESLRESSSLYTAKLTFGKRTFNLEVTDKRTGKVAFAVYPFFQQTEHFVFDKSKSIDYHEVYRLERQLNNTRETYEVDIYMSPYTTRVNVNYSVSELATRNITEAFSGARKESPFKN